jgi:hypothetical protein
MLLREKIANFVTNPAVLSIYSLKNTNAEKLNRFNSYESIGYEKNCKMSVVVDIL